MSRETPKKQQPTISSFFSQSPSTSNPRTRKRSHAPIDLTVDSDEDSFEITQPPSKKSRTEPKVQTHGTAQQGHKSNISHTLSASGFGEVVSQWQFRSDSPSLSQPRSTQSPEQRKDRDRAKRILLADSSFFSQPGGAGDLDVQDDDAEGSSSGNESDSRFSEMMEMFSYSNRKQKKGKGKPKASNLSRGKGKHPKVTGPSGQAYTPLELQITRLKKKYPDTLLIVEVGYKCHFYGEDAQVAAKELGILCYQKRNFLSASIPVHRREIHLKKLLSRGYRVGIIEQTETAALKKVGDTRNELFSRGLTALYTAVTYIDELNSVDDLDPTAAPTLMCLVEEPKGGMGVDERVLVGMIIIAPSTGDIIWDEFEDNHMRTELETRMVHTKPYEVLLPQAGLSKPSEKMIKYFTEHTNSISAMDVHKIRIERFKDILTYTEAFSALTKFYTNDYNNTNAAAASENYNSGKLMAAVSDFPKLVTVTLSHTLKYLSAFNLQHCLRETKFFSKFTERTHMLLNGNTLSNLEIYNNETDYATRGSLMWILDKTSTKFGARMLRSWVGRPLVNTKVLQDRIDAVEELLQDHTPKSVLLSQLLVGLPDLAKGLCRIQYGKCTPQELARLLPAFRKIATTFQPGTALFKSPVLNDIVAALPRLRDLTKYLSESVSLKNAKEGKKETLWTDPQKFPNLDDIMASVQMAEVELMEELKNIRKTIKKPAAKYTTCAGEEYLIEIGKDERRDVPLTWSLVSSTRSLRRYRPPEVRDKMQQRARWLETLALEANKAYESFLHEIQEHYALLRDAVNKLAIADCLLSLARVAAQNTFVRPQFVPGEEGEEGVLEIMEGRHPMVEVLRSDPFVPNTVCLGGGKPGSKIITGPNMGGKSSAVRMIALCAIMAQVGSYVPAESMRIGLLDGILTRMGAFDELARGRSTFMVEMQETSDIMRLATPKTLVILDELGRGTSTFDGMAIASAVLQHLIQTTKCKTLFITHYPQVAADLARTFPAAVENLHMGYIEDMRIDGTREVTFLYRLMPGIAQSSFGIECGRLAGLPESVLKVAASRAEMMREVIEKRVKRHKTRQCAKLILTGTRTPSEEALIQLKDAMRSLGDLYI